MKSNKQTNERPSKTQMVAFNTQLANTHKMDFPLIIFLAQLLARSFIQLSLSIAHSSVLFLCAKRQTDIFAQFYRIYCCCTLHFFLLKTIATVRKSVFILHFSTLFCALTLTVLSSLHSPSLSLSLVFVCVCFFPAYMVFHYVLSFICMRKHPLYPHIRTQTTTITGTYNTHYQVSHRKIA